MIDYKKLSAYWPDSPEQVENRIARCYMCKQEQPSSLGLTGKLAFYEYMGGGSRIAIETCRCGLYMHVHNDELWAKRPDLTSHEPTPRGALEFDTFYCGCRGWD